MRSRRRRRAPAAGAKGLGRRVPLRTPVHSWTDAVDVGASGVGRGGAGAGVGSLARRSSRRAGRWPERDGRGGRAPGAQGRGGRGLFEGRLQLGQHQDVVAGLHAAVEAEPLRQRRWAQLMLALYRTGRKVEAGRAFQRLHHILVEEYGLEPSAEVVALDHSIAPTVPNCSGLRRAKPERHPHRRWSRGQRGITCRWPCRPPCPSPIPPRHLEVVRRGRTQNVADGTWDTLPRSSHDGGPRRAACSSRRMVHPRRHHRRRGANAVHRPSGRLVVGIVDDERLLRCKRRRCEAFRLRQNRQIGTTALGRLFSTSMSVNGRCRTVDDVVLWVGIGRLGHWLSATHLGSAHRPRPYLRRARVRQTTSLETDHSDVDYADGGPTALANLVRLCPGHHDMKTNGGWKIVGGHGRRKWVPPEKPPTAGRIARGGVFPPPGRRLPDDQILTTGQVMVRVIPSICWMSRTTMRPSRSWSTLPRGR